MENEKNDINAEIIDEIKNKTRALYELAKAYINTGPKYYARAKGILERILNSNPNYREAMELLEELEKKMKEIEGGL